MDARSKENTRGEPQTTDETNADESSQRKRSRMRSHPEEKASDEPTSEHDNETALKPTEAEDESIEQTTAPGDAAPVKRRKLNVTEAKTNDTSADVPVASASNDDEYTDEDDEDDDDDDDEEEEEDGEDDDVSIDKDLEGATDEGQNLPPTTNRYLRLRQRELGIFHRSRKHNTCRAFHDNIIASRNVVQRMKVSHTLDGHDGCVNALAFNRIGKSDPFDR